jgi:hypothetical protein
MRKEIVRREFLKLRLMDCSYNESKIELERIYNAVFSIRTLKRWWKRVK